MSDDAHPAFSILAPAYRTEQYLAQTIESVLSQTRADWEMVVVDNGMSDEVCRIVSKYSHDPRIRLIRQENRGIAGGVTAAAAAARGRYFTVLATDDMLAPEYCARLGSVLDARPEIDALGSDAYLFDHDAPERIRRSYLHSIGIRRRPSAQHRLTLKEALTGYVPHYTGAIRREAWFAAGGFEGAIPDVEHDVNLWLRLLMAGFDVRMLPDRLGRSRIRPDSFSRHPEKIDDYDRRLENTVRSAALESGAAEHLDALQKQLRKIRYNQLIRHARSHLLNDDPHAAQVAAREAFSAQPTVRAGLILVSLRVAPRAMRNLHPAKQRLTAATRRVAGRLAGHAAGARDGAHHDA